MSSRAASRSGAAAGSLASGEATTGRAEPDRGRVGLLEDAADQLRPWPVVTILRDAAIAGQIPSRPADYWLLPATPSKLS
jgi:hypothetical protein